MLHDSGIRGEEKGKKNAFFDVVHKCVSTCINMYTDTFILKLGGNIYGHYSPDLCNWSCGIADICSIFFNYLFNVCPLPSASTSDSSGLSTWS